MLEPPHGWRSFANEIVIVVIGVLIALGAGQLVDGINERDEISQLRRGIRAELANDRARWTSIHQQETCALARLAAIERWAQSAPGNARLLDLPSPHFWNLHWSAWDTAKASGALEDMPLSERLTYSDLYDAMANQQRYIFAAQGEWQTIAGLAATADHPDARQQLRQAVARARYDILYRRRSNYTYLIKRFDALNVKPDASGLSSSATGSSYDPRALCEPLSY